MKSYTVTIRTLVGIVASYIAIGTNTADIEAAARSGFGDTPIGVTVIAA